MTRSANTMTEPHVGTNGNRGEVGNGSGAISPVSIALTTDNCEGIDAVSGLVAPTTAPPTTTTETETTGTTTKTNAITDRIQEDDDAGKGKVREKSSARNVSLPSRARIVINKGDEVGMILHSNRQHHSHRHYHRDQDQQDGHSSHSQKYKYPRHLNHPSLDRVEVKDTNFIDIVLNSPRALTSQARNQGAEDGVVATTERDEAKVEKFVHRNLEHSVRDGAEVGASSSVTLLRDLQRRNSSIEGSFSSTNSASSSSFSPLDLTVSEIRALKEAFDQADPNDIGVDVDVFQDIVQNFWSSKASSHASKIFELFDLRSVHRLRLREFVCGYALLCRSDKHQRIKYLYSVANSQGDGFIREDSLIGAIKLLNTLAKRVHDCANLGILRSSRHSEGPRSATVASSRAHAEMNSDAQPVRATNANSQSVTSPASSSSISISRISYLVSRLGGIEALRNTDLVDMVKEVYDTYSEHMDTAGNPLLNYQSFNRFCEEHPKMSLWLDIFSDLADDSVPRTLRLTKEHEMIALELERMGIMSVGENSAQSLLYERNKAKMALSSSPPPSKKTSEDEISSDTGTSNTDSHRLDALTSSIELDIGSSLREVGAGSNEVTFASQPLPRQESVDRKDSASNLLRQTRHKARGPKLMVRRSTKPQQSMNDSPFAIDYESLRLKKIIGRGSYATVWSAEWLHMPVAVKVFENQESHAGNANDSIGEKRPFRDYAAYLREIELLSQLRHPNVLLYMGACCSPEKPFCIVTELYHGGSLHDILKQHRDQRALDPALPPRAFTPDEALQLALGMARGMLYLHSSSPTILHRDLKASNILIDTTRFHCVICDFGLSRIQDLSANSTHGSGATIVGTPYSMAPEVMEGASYTTAADVYSFGIVLWELWTGRKPFDGMKPIQLMFQVFSENARPDILPEDHFHPLIDQIIRHCWEADPLNRPSFEEVLDVLETDVLQSEVNEMTKALEAHRTQQLERAKSDGRMRLMTAELMDSVYGGKTQLVQQLLAQGVSPNFADYDKRTPLHIACAEGFIDLVQLLIASGADINLRDRWGATPLVDASRGGHRAIVEILKKSGAVEQASTHGNQEMTNLLSLQLMSCIHQDNLEGVLALIKQGASVNFADYDRRSPLHLAAAEGRMEIVKELIRCGADIECRDRWGSTPLNDAQRAGCREIELLLHVTMARRHAHKKA